MHMRLALLSGAQPQTAQDGPRVRLSKGNWRLKYDGVTDSSFFIVLNSKPFNINKDAEGEEIVPLPVKNGEVLLLDKAVVANLVWLKRGSEPHVSVIAEKVA